MIIFVLLSVAVTQPPKHILRNSHFHDFSQSAPVVVIDQQSPQLHVFGQKVFALVVKGHGAELGRVKPTTSENFLPQPDVKCDLLAGVVFDQVEEQLKFRVVQPIIL